MAGLVRAIHADPRAEPGDDEGKGRPTCSKTGLVRLLVAGLWVAWGAYWVAAAYDTKRTRWREPRAELALYVVPLLLCAVLLGAPRLVPAILRARFAPPGAFLPALGAFIVAAGLGFAVWARRHLGREWSGLVTLKEGHALIRTGPYKKIRHPIYTGLLLAVAGTALAIGEWRGVVAIGCALIGVIRKVHAEEALLRRAFPQYAEYRKTTARWSRCCIDLLRQA